ncbi:MAG: aminotransferase class III-fold pyridoxal phosphate-dependent enzyme, partial [Myxococcota bacterium]
GAYFRAQLNEMNSPLVREVRGKGLLTGVEMTQAAGPAKKYCYALMKLGLLAKDTHETVIRFAPPLIISKQDLDWALTRIRQVLCPS